jgi:uncharacterized protein with HEPN domain
MSEEEVKEDYKLFFEYLKDSLAANYIFRELLQDIRYMTWESNDFVGDEKTTILLLLGQIEEDYNLMEEAVGTTEIILQEHHEEISNLRIEAIRDLIIVTKGLKENWHYSWIFDRLDTLQKKLHEAIKDFVVGLGQRAKGQGSSGSDGSAAQGSSA